MRKTFSPFSFWGSLRFWRWRPESVPLLYYARLEFYLAHLPTEGRSGLPVYRLFRKNELIILNVYPSESSCHGPFVMQNVLSWT